ncbi:ABC transporter ATP-binding protein [Vallitalea okinawensis]|uniref:ABC transporter ATP-binding protein n=1 Tax=Vallitalea okinawensis TaxID=2078660 RepID=UPI000CFAA297|nr:ATP-binding cassette domain-containing protein [Vallitalea okinawensis]
MIEVRGLTKKYGEHVALNNVNFNIEKGEIVGFLGPNGAGKSTSMNILTGYISATDGEAMIDGIDILENPIEAKKKIGYLPEQPPLYFDMTVDEYIDFVCALKKVPKKEVEENKKRIYKLVKIQDVRGRLIKNLSKGYKQRVGLAQALVGNPEVLILDEPTVGLDPKQIIEIRTLVRELGKEHTVILSSHILSEVSAVCDRVIIINKGKIVASDTPENLSRIINQVNRLSLRIVGPKTDVLKSIKEIPGVKYAEIDRISEKGSVDIVVEGEDEIDIRIPIFNVCKEKDYPIIMMKSLDVSLEDIFLEVTGQKKAGEAYVSDLQ